MYHVCDTVSNHQITLEEVVVVGSSPTLPPCDAHSNFNKEKNVNL